MHIGLNAFFWPLPNTGSGQYLRHLLRALNQVTGDHRFTLYRPRRIHPDLKGDLAKLWFEQVGFPLACHRGGVNVAHVPYFAPPLLRNVPLVVTIHDLIPLILAPYRGSVLVRAYTLLVSLAARRADLILADSECSRQDIIRLLRVPPERVWTVYLGVDERYRPLDRAELEAVRRKYGLPPRYILYLGGFDVRKNLTGLLRAFARVAQRQRRPFLAIAGKIPPRETPLFPDPRHIVEELGLESRVRFIGWVEEDDKPALYAGALAFVFPSLYEGFGLPVLEAMACGTPVVASRRGSLPEIVGEGGLLVDTEEELAEAMAQIVEDEELRTRLRERALSQASRFRWEDTARQTLAAYAAVAR